LHGSIHVQIAVYFTRFFGRPLLGFLHYDHLFTVGTGFATLRNPWKILSISFLTILLFELVSICNITLSYAKE
jgi:hypothetical protein